jgi:hypothetical protein
MAGHALVCAACGPPIESQSNSWHYKNAFMGVAIWLASFVVAAGVVTALSEQGGGISSSRPAQGLWGIVFVLGAVFLALFFTSRRVERWTLGAAAEATQQSRMALGRPVEGWSRAWHLKNALMGVAIWLLWVVVACGAVVAGARQGDGDSGSKAGLGLVMLVMVLGGTFGVSLLISRRAQKWILALTSAAFAHSPLVADAGGRSERDVPVDGGPQALQGQSGGASGAVEANGRESDAPQESGGIRGPARAVGDQVQGRTNGETTQTGVLVRESTWEQAVKICLVAGVIYGILFWLFHDSAKARMIAFAVIFVPSVAAIKPTEKKVVGIVVFIVCAFVVFGVAAALNGKLR